jgi:hypothetical protein
MEETMKVYISGPITGVPDFNRDAFTAAAAALRAQGYDPLNPHDVIPNSTTGATWEECLRGDIAALATECDGIALLDGWESSRGSKLEVHIGMALHMKVQPIQSWLEEEVYDPQLDEAISGAVIRRKQG